MLATTGYITQEILRWPGYLSPSSQVKFAEIPNGIKGLAAVPPAGLAQILLFIGVMEVATWRYYEGPFPGKVPAGKAPGDVAGDLWVRYADPEVKKTKLNIELNNGRVRAAHRNPRRDTQRCQHHRSQSCSSRLISRSHTLCALCVRRRR